MHSNGIKVSFKPSVKLDKSDIYNLIPILIGLLQFCIVYFLFEISIVTFCSACLVAFIGIGYLLTQFYSNTILVIEKKGITVKNQLRPSSYLWKDIKFVNISKVSNQLLRTVVVELITYEETVKVVIYPYIFSNPYISMNKLSSLLVKYNSEINLELKKGSIESLPPPWLVVHS